MILGVGAGTFAVLLAIGIAVLFAVLGSYLLPDAALFVLLGCVALPLVVYGCILTAPRAVTGEPAAFSPYRDTPMPVNSELVDRLMPVNIVVFILMTLAALGGIAFQVLSCLTAPPYTVPRMKCLREQMEAAHPTWYH